MAGLNQCLSGALFVDRRVSLVRDEIDSDA